MAEFNDLTADVSEEESELNDDSLDAPLPNLPEIDRRLSASQPILNAEARTKKRFASLGSVKEVDGFPFLQVQEDNERLKNENIELREQLADVRTRRSFAEEQLPLPVREILDDYLRLQRIVRDSDDKGANYDNLEKECTQLQKENQRLMKVIDETVHKYEAQLQKKLQEMEQMKRDYIGDDDFTLNSEVDVGNKTIGLELNQQKIINQDYLKKIAELEQDLERYKERINEVDRTLIEKADSSVTRTFVVSENEQQLAKRNEELMAEKADVEHRYQSCNAMLCEYMNRLNKLQKNLMLSALSSNQINLSSSFDVNDKQRVENVLEKMKSELLAEKDQNRKLRKEVNQLMGKSLSSDSSESVETALEAMEDTMYADQMKDKIVDEVDDLLHRMKNLGFDEPSMNNELLDTIDRGEPIDLHNKSQEMMDRFAEILPIQPQPLPDVEQLSLLNSSLGNILTTSMNAAHNITVVKENLESFRETLVAMFERLKSSASLFDEIRQVLSDGEHNPLVDRIQDMQLLWNSAVTKVDDVSKVIVAAEQSIIGMQGHISMLEQTIVNTTFVLDQTRRVTFSNLSFISRLGQGDPSVAEEDKVGELEEQIKELNEQIKDLTNARDGAQLQIEHCERQYRDSEMEKDELYTQLEDMKVEYNRLQMEKDRIEDDLSIINKDHIHVKSLLDRNMSDLDRDKNKITDLEAEVADLRNSVGCLTSVREDLIRKLVDGGFEVEEARAKVKSHEEARRLLEERLEELQMSHRALQQTCDESQLALSRKTSEFDKARKDLESKVELLEDQLAAVRERVSCLGPSKLIGFPAEDVQKELVALQMFEKELDLHTNSPHTWPSVASSNTSLLYKETQPQVSTQTNFNLESMKELEEIREKLDIDLRSLLSIYNELQIALRDLLFTSESGDYNQVKDVRGARKSCDRLKKAIAEQAVYDAKTKEQMERISEDLEQRVIRSSMNSSVSKKDVSSKFITTDISEIYQSRLSRDVNAAFVKTMDLAYNLKVAVDAKSKGYEFDLVKLNEDAKAIRTLLHETKLYLGTKFNKENLHDQSNDVILMLKSMDQDNRELFEKLSDTMSKYRELKKSSTKPDVLARIDKELNSIHDVMQRTRDIVSPLTRKN